MAKATKINLSIHTNSIMKQGPNILDESLGSTGRHVKEFHPLSMCVVHQTSHETLLLGYVISASAFKQTLVVVSQLDLDLNSTTDSFHGKPTKLLTKSSSTAIICFPHDSVYFHSLVSFSAKIVEINKF